MSKRGRRPRGRSPMPPVTITALPEELAFLTLLGEGSTSFGVQKATRMLIEQDAAAEELFRQATWIKSRVIAILEKDGKEATEVAIYKYISANFYDLADEASKAGS